MCCFSVRLSLPDLLLLYGQVGVGISGGLEASVHSLHMILSMLGSDSSLCCLKLDMTNTFNDCSRSSFCLIVTLIYLSFLLGIFIPFSVETLGLWSPASLKVLRDTAIRTTNRSGAGIAFACHHFFEQTVCVFMEARCPHVPVPLQFVACWPFVGVKP